MKKAQTVTSVSTFDGTMDRKRLFYLLRIYNPQSEEVNIKMTTVVSSRKDGNETRGLVGLRAWSTLWANMIVDDRAVNVKFAENNFKMVGGSSKKMASDIAICLINHINNIDDLLHLIKDNIEIAMEIMKDINSLEDHNIDEKYCNELSLDSTEQKIRHFFHWQVTLFEDKKGVETKLKWLITISKKINTKPIVFDKLVYKGTNLAMIKYNFSISTIDFFELDNHVNDTSKECFSIYHPDIKKKLRIIVPKVLPFDSGTDLKKMKKHTFDIFSSGYVTFWCTDIDKYEEVLGKFIKLVSEVGGIMLPDI
jgi:hypothetical protein